MRGRHALALGICIAATSGCTTASYVRSEAARDFRCPEQQVQVSPAGSMFRAVGCGRDAIYTGALSTPVARATFDLQCPAAQIHMASLGHETVGVEGCGRRASYAYVDGEWVGGPTR